LIVPHEAIAASREAGRFARFVVAGHGAQGLIEALAGLRILT